MRQVALCACLSYKSAAAFGNEPDGQENRQQRNGQQRRDDLREICMASAVTRTLSASWRFSSRRSRTSRRWLLTP